jgi:hypothetical protein
MPPILIASHGCNAEDDMSDFSIGAISTLAIIIIIFVIRAAASHPRKIPNKVVFEDSTTSPWSPPTSAPAPTTIIEQAPKKDLTNFHSVTVAVYIPLMLSLVSGFIASLLTLFIMKIWWSWMDALTGAGISFVLIVAIVWVWRLMDWQKLIHQIEMITHSDIDGDGYQGEPTSITEHVTIKHYDKNGTWTRTHEGIVNLTHEEKIKLAFALLMQKRSFSEDALARGRDGYSKIFSQPRFAKVQDEFIAAELVNRKNNGYELNDDGARYLEDALPSPTVDSVSLPAPVGKVGTR